MEIESVPVTDRTDARSVENDTAVSFHVFNVSEYHQPDLSVRIEQTKGPVIRLLDLSLPHDTSLHTTFRMYGFNYSCGTFSFPFHPGVNAEYATTISTGHMTVASQVLNYGAKFLFL